MIYNYNQIIDDISTQIMPSEYPKFYIGITSNIDSRLFGDHNVLKGAYGYKYYQAMDESTARLVEKYFLDRGMQGGSGGGNGDGTAVFVYCYYITSYTNQ